MQGHKAGEMNIITITISQFRRVQQPLRCKWTNMNKFMCLEEQQSGKDDC